MTKEEIYYLELMKNGWSTQIAGMNAMDEYAKQESTAFARWLDTYNHPIGERQSFETLYDIYKTPSK